MPAVSSLGRRLGGSAKDVVCSRIGKRDVYGDALLEAELPDSVGHAGSSFPKARLEVTRSRSFLETRSPRFLETQGDLHHKLPSRLDDSSHLREDRVHVKGMVERIRENEIYRVIGEDRSAKIASQNILTSLPRLQVYTDSERTTVQKRLDLRSQTRTQAQHRFSPKILATCAEAVPQREAVVSIVIVYPISNVRQFRGLVTDILAVGVVSSMHDI